MSDPLEFVPGYISPLTDKEHARIGRITLLWGQVEHFAEQILPAVTKLHWDDLVAINIPSKGIGNVISLIRAANTRMPKSQVRSDIEDFCDEVNAIKQSRNKIFHGIWGWRASGRGRTVEAAARKTSEPEHPLRVSQLPKVEKSLCKCSRLGSEIVRQLWNETTRVKYTRYFHHDQNADSPEWLMRWTEHNPLDDALLDRIGKEGQLPRLEHPYPRK